VLAHERQQFGIHLTEDPLGVRRPPVINAAVTLPELEQEFNGLITNDKFCMVRTGRVTLSWARSPLQRFHTAGPQQDYPLDHTCDSGGRDEADMADAAPDGATF
jgi:hypothetical protein